jgi:hypothetical protein
MYLTMRKIVPEVREKRELENTTIVKWVLLRALDTTPTVA